MNEQRERESAIILPFERPPNLKLAGSEPPNGNYLATMVAGTRFLAKSKTDGSSILDDYILSTDPKSMSAVMLAKNINSRDGVFSWHDPIIFCRNNALYLTLEILEPTNGNSDQVPSGSMASDAQPEVIDSLDEKE